MFLAKRFLVDSGRIKFRQDIVIYANKEILGDSICSYEKNSARNYFCCYFWSNSSRSYIKIDLTYPSN